MIAKRERKVTHFDYSRLEPEDTIQLRAAAERIKRIIHQSEIEVGSELLAAKARLKHGMFLLWVRQEFGMKPRTAENHMRAAQLVGKDANFAHLPKSARYALAAPSATAAAQEQVLQSIRLGKRPTVKDVQIVVRSEPLPPPRDATAAVAAAIPGERVRIYCGLLRDLARLTDVTKLELVAMETLGGDAAIYDRVLDGIAKLIELREAARNTVH